MRTFLTVSAIGILAAAPLAASAQPRGHAGGGAHAGGVVGGQRGYGGYRGGYRAGYGGYRTFGGYGWRGRGWGYPYWGGWGWGYYPWWGYPDYCYDYWSPYCAYGGPGPYYDYDAMPPPCGHWTWRADLGRYEWTPEPCPAPRDAQ